MPKVIHKIKQICEVAKLTSRKLFHSELHRGLDFQTLIHNGIPARVKRRLTWTLASFVSRLRCSSTYIRNLQKIRIIGFVSSFLLFIFTFLSVHPLILSPDSAEGTSGTATASTTSIIMTSGFESAGLSLTPNNANGTFASSSSSELAKFGIATDNYTGYTLSISADDDNGLLTNTDTSITTNNTLSPLDSAINSATFDTALYNGKWGYKPSKYNSVSNTDMFYPAPTTTASTLDATDTPNSKKTGASGNTVDCTNYDCNEYTIGLGARVDYSKPAGTYTSTFTLTAVANPIIYSITYADSTGDSSVAGLPTFSTSTNHTQAGSTDAAGIALSSTVPTRTGYTFKSWCLGTVSGSNPHTGTVCTGQEFNSGATYGIDQTLSNEVTIYAVWTPKTYDITIKSATGLSKVSLNGIECTNTSTGCVVTGLTYNKSYNLVATTAAGYSFNSWSKTGQGTIASTSSASTTFTVGADTATITPSTILNKYTCTKQYRLQNANDTWGSYTTDTTEQVNYGATCSYSKTVTDYKGSASGTNGSAATESGTMTENGLTLQVSLYRNTYTLTVSRNTTYISSASATTSAVHGSNYYRWGQAVSIAATASSGNEFTSWTQSGTAGTFANANSASTTFTMGKGNATVTAGGKQSKLYFQNATSADCGKTMYDNRGSDTYKNVAYTTAKIGSLCWMTRNLDLPGGTTLTSSDSHVASNYTLPASSTSGFSSDTTAYVYNSGRTTCSSPGCYSYYSWTAATAGTNGSSYDICPKGWRLPTSAELTTLKNTYTTGATLTGSPFLAVYAGYYDLSTFYGGGSYGRYWSSTPNGSSSTYLLYYSSSSADVYDYRRRYGYSVRCVAQS